MTSKTPNLPPTLQDDLGRAIGAGDRAAVLAVGRKAYEAELPLVVWLGAVLDWAREESAGEGAGTRWAHALQSLAASAELSEALSEEAGWAAALGATEFLACARPSRKRTLDPVPALPLDSGAWTDALRNGRWASVERSLVVGWEGHCTNFAGETGAMDLSGTASDGAQEVRAVVAETGFRLDRQWGHAALMAQAMDALGARLPRHHLLCLRFALRSWASGEGDAGLARRVEEAPLAAGAAMPEDLHQLAIHACREVVRRPSWRNLHTLCLASAAVDAVDRLGLAPLWPFRSLRAALDPGTVASEERLPLAPALPGLETLLEEACRCEVLPSFGHHLQLAAAVLRLQRLLSGEGPRWAVAALAASQPSWVLLRRPWLVLRSA